MLAKRPPLGWNSWNTFGPEINEKVVLDMADMIVDKGYRDAGYEYVVIDDIWLLRHRDENGALIPDPEKFPHGMKYVADYVHSKGLKFGMYSCAGVRTCAGYPSSFDHEYQDARQFASWGVDFLKYDFCNFPITADCKNRYLTMSMALKASGREILFSACNWGVEEPWNWMRSIGAHMYRSTGDIMDNYKSQEEIMKSQLKNFNANASGCFNDMDMLTVGMCGKTFTLPDGLHAGCTYDEYEMQFAFWCFCGAPLMMGADLRSVGEEYRALMQNKELLRLDQDEECRPAYHVRMRDENHIVLLRQLADGEFALALFNFYDGKRTLDLPLSEIGVPVGSGTTLALTDVMTGEELHGVRDDLFTPVKGHNMRIFRCRFEK